LTDKAAKNSFLKVAVDEPEAFIQVNGRGSFVLSPTLKKLGVYLIDKSYSNIIFDFINCEEVDSTFIGVLTGLTLRLEKKFDTKLVLLNTSKKVYEAIDMLGITRLLNCYLKGQGPEDLTNRLKEIDNAAEVEKSDTKTEDMYKTMTEAHENLIKVDKSNAPKFRNVLKFLREELKQSEE
jgi:anti-sigma B factor antagonist